MGRERSWVGIAVVAASIFSNVSFARAQAGSASSGPHISVFIYEHADVPARTLAQAELRAENTFRRIGVELSWLRCDAGGLPDSAAACGAALSPTDLVLRMEKGASAAGNEPDACGAALVPKKRELAVYMTVAYDCVRDRANAADVAVADVLGYVIAHEAGHLVSGSSEHSPCGLMSAEWNREVLLRAARGQLYFTREEIARIRREARSRELMSRSRAAEIASEEIIKE